MAVISKGRSAVTKVHTGCCYGLFYLTATMQDEVAVASKPGGTVGRPGQEAMTPILVTS